MHILRALDVLFRPSTHQNWPQDRKLTQGVKITRFQVLIIRSHFISIWAVVIRVTDIRFVEKDHSLSLL